MFQQSVRVGFLSKRVERVSEGVQLATCQEFRRAQRFGSLLPFNGDGRQVRYLFNGVVMLRSWAARFAPVDSEDSQYGSVRRQDRCGPPGSQSVCQSQFAIIGPQRICRDVTDDDLLFAVSGRSARTHTRTDLDAIHRSHERFWKAGPCTAPQATTVWINQ